MILIYPSPPPTFHVKMAIKKHNIYYINVALTIPTALTSPLLKPLSSNELVGVLGAVISSSPSPSSHISAVI